MSLENPHERKRARRGAASSVNLAELARQRAKARKLQRKIRRLNSESDNSSSSDSEHSMDHSDNIGEDSSDGEQVDDIEFTDVRPVSCMLTRLCH